MVVLEWAVLPQALKTDDIIKKMLAGQQAKIDKAKQRKTTNTMETRNV